MNYDFIGKSIKCETWEQMLHLAKLAEEQKAKCNVTFPFDEKTFNNGNVWFVLNKKQMQYVCQSVPTSLYDIETTYTDFINPPLPTETIEVTGCDGCVLSTWNRYRTGVWCGLQYEDEMPPTKLFTTCPLKKSSITIKLKQNDTTGN